MDGLEVLSYDGVGYNRTMHYESWRVAIANYCELFDRDLYTKIERHRLTDEVFVLLSGRAALVIGKERTEVEMEPHKLYNVKANTWHNVLIDRDAKVLIVENHSTGPENTEYIEFER